MGKPITLERFQRSCISQMAYSRCSAPTLRRAATRLTDFYQGYTNSKNALVERLTKPLVRRGGKLQPATWTEAMDLIVDRTRELREKYTAGPHARFWFLSRDVVGVPGAGADRF